MKVVLGPVVYGHQPISMHKHWFVIMCSLGQSTFVIAYSKKKLCPGYLKAANRRIQKDFNEGTHYDRVNKNRDLKKIGF